MHANDLVLALVLVIVSVHLTLLQILVLIGIHALVAGESVGRWVVLHQRSLALASKLVLLVVKALGQL